MQQRPGFTLIEMTMTLSIVVLVVTGATMLTTNAARSFDHSSAQLDADQNASAAVQHMMLDLEEAKQVSVLSSTSLRVFFPQVAADGTYIRSALDTVNTIDYYRGWANGTADAAGDSLLRRPAGGTARVVCAGVISVQFSSTNPSSVDIRLQDQRSCVLQPAQRDMIHRAIFLRNY